jgi:hypothetical protein
MTIFAPRVLCAASAAIMMTVATTDAAMAFNPQPDPPKAARSFNKESTPALRKSTPAKGRTIGGLLLPKLGAIRGFNPQPEPPMKSVGPSLRR